MTRKSISTLLLALSLTACSSGSDAADANPPSSGTFTEDPPPAENQPMAALHENIAATAAREEHDAQTVKVAHILIAFKGAERSTATRSKEEAEQRTADLLARVEAGEDFLELMRASSDDPGPGVYGMTAGAPKQGYYPRAQMAGAFGDTGWRLQVDEVGVAGYDPDKSPFGWHIIKRVE